MNTARLQFATFLGTLLVLIATLAHAQWTTARLSQARGGLVGVTAGNLVFFAGGRTATSFDPDVYSDVVDIYDSSTKTWRTARLSQPRASLAAIAFRGKVYFAGGETARQNAVVMSDVIDIYDIASDTWSTHKLSVARAHPSAGLSDNTVIFQGGFLDYGPDPAFGNVATGATDMYYPDEDKWRVDSSQYAIKGYMASVSFDGVNGYDNHTVFAGGLPIFTGSEVPDEAQYGSKEVVSYLGELAPAGRLTEGVYALAGAGNFVYSTPFSVFAGGRTYMGKDTDRGYNEPELEPTEAQSYGSDQVSVMGEYGADNFALAVSPRLRLSVARSRLAAARLPASNEVFFAGGMVNGRASKAVDVYEYLYMERVDSLSVARYRLAGAGVGNQVLFAGGFTRGFSVNGQREMVTDVVDIYTDPLFAPPPPVITLHPEPATQTACAGGDARTTVAASGNDLRYRWLKGAPDVLKGTFVQGQHQPTLALTNVQPTDAGQYYCEVWNGHTSVWSQPFTLLVTTLDLGTPRVMSAPACAGQPITVSVVANCSGSGLTVQLSNSFGSFANPTALGAAVPGTTSFILPANLTPGTGYRVRVVSSTPTQTSPASAPFRVEGPSLSGAPTVSGAPVCRGGLVTVNFSLPVGGCPFPEGNTFTAQLSSGTGSFANPTNLGAVLPGVANRVTIPASVAAGTGYRIRVVSDSPALISQASAPFTVNTLGQVSVALYPATPSRICLGDELPVTFSTTGPCPFPVENVFTIQLSGSTGSFAAPLTLGTGQPGTTGFVLPQNLPAGTGYRVRILSSNPALTSASSAPFELRYPSLAGVTPGVGGVPQGGICRGQAVTLSFSLTSGSCAFPGGNGFTAQLSSASGSFASPVALGAIVPGIPTAVTIPASVAAGTGYRIRVVSSSPALISLASLPFRVNATGCSSRLSAEEAGLVVAPNPVSGGQIRVRVSGMDHPEFSLTTSVGRHVMIGVESGGGGDFALTPRQRLPVGVYVLEATEGHHRISQRVLVTE